MTISNKGMSVKHRVEFITSPDGALEIRFFDNCTEKINKLTKFVPGALMQKSYRIFTWAELESNQCLN